MQIFVNQTRALIDCALVVLATHGVALSQSSSDKARKIDEVLSAANKYHLFNGSVLVAENGKVIHKKGYGHANMEWNILNTPDTKMWVGANIKKVHDALI